MFVTSGVEKEVKYCVLTRQGGGGACVAKTRQAVLVGIYGRDIPMSNGKV